MYYIWHTYFINQEHENISLSRIMGDPLTFVSRSHELFTLSNDLCSGAPGPTVTIFHIQPPRARRTKIYSNSRSLLTKMSAMPIYDKKKTNLRKSSSPGPRNREPGNFV